MAIATSDQWPPDDSGLTVDQRASMWLGYVVRADVDMEWELRRIWITMMGGGAVPAAVAPRDWNPLYREVKDLINAYTDLWPDTELPVLARAAIEEAQQHHQLRNRLAHDVWYLDDGEDERFHFVKYFGNGQAIITVKHLAEFRDCHHQLMRDVWRLYSLGWLILGVTGDPFHREHRERAPAEYADAAARHRSVLHGNFSVGAPGTMTSDR